MALDAGFVEDIEHPDSTVLQAALSQARDRTTERLREMGFHYPDEWLIQTVACAYCHDWAQADPQYAFVLPDPGDIDREFDSEVRSLRSSGPDVPPRERVAFDQQIASAWFTDHETRFPREFFTALAEQGLIAPADDRERYVADGEFFEEFYLTHAVKYRLNGYSTAQGAAAFSAQLGRELDAVDPTVIFTVGERTWQTLREGLGLTHEGSASAESLTDAHGQLHRADETFVIPLGPTSGTEWWQFPPTAYVERLERALARLRETVETLQTPDSR